MTDIFAQFHHDWTQLFGMDPPPKGSQDIETTDDGADGVHGKPGRPGTTIGGPGQGQRGGDGTASGDLDNTGDALIFHKAHPLGFWAQIATTGFGGDGGTGGNAGAFNSSHDSGPWPDGGDGGNGGDSGMATVTLAHHTIWGGRGDRLGLSIGSTTRDGGNGGNGGNGDGENGPVNQPGGDGGNGGIGGNAGDAVINITSDTLMPVGNARQPYPVSISAYSEAGTGGAGGFGGHGGVGLTPGADGMGGIGGGGGDARVVINDVTVSLTGAAGAVSSFFVDALAYSGSGGHGGSATGNPNENFAPGGHAGNASIVLNGVTVTGGAEDDTISIHLECFPGNDGVAGNNTFDNVYGTASYTVTNNTFNGGGGNNSFGFGLGSSESGFAVTIDLVAHTFAVNGVASGTVKNFENVVGAGGGDLLIGDDAANRITGGSGMDHMHGGKGADVFAYRDLPDSYSVFHDWIDDLKLGTDHIALPFAVNRTDKAIGSAVIHSDSFDGDLLHTADAAHLHKHSAVLIHADYFVGAASSEKVFLVIDFNGTAGYQAFDDIVIDVTGIVGTKLTVDTFIDL